VCNTIKVFPLNLHRLVVIAWSLTLNAAYRRVVLDRKQCAWLWPWIGTEFGGFHWRNVDEERSGTAHNTKAHDGLGAQVLTTALDL
jgi:hypothetical protein